MGITLHYTFFRRAKPEVLLQRIATKAIELGMRVEHFGPTHLLIDPHPDCECIDLHWRQWKTLNRDCDNGEDADEKQWVKDYITRNYSRLVSDEDWVCTGFTKTQFAGLECHRTVAELLRQVAAYCRLSDVGDEAAYYELGTDGYDKAERAFDASSKAISRLAGQLKEQFGSDNVFCGQDGTSTAEDI